MKKIKCYKVCRVENGRYYSVMVDNKRYEIEYKVGRYVKPKVGSIFAFSNLEDAKEFSDTIRENTTVFECEGVLSKRQPKCAVEVCSNKDMYLYWDCSDEDDFEQFWEELDCSGDAKLYEIMDLIDGTIFLDKVKLLKEVKSV